MNARTRQYLFGLIFLGVGVYQLVKVDYIEATLYLLAGMSFVLNTLTLEPALSTYRKVLVPATWILMIATGILFLYVIQFKYF